ncbi:pyridoxamine 5'-phosphate oxidase family protein [Actinomadura oligospora]|uniref:pyridoxamine 5'-phosphate oxidase family protein n=1 Tax=Actinomadura oligospora TaxID=111804 RepID=UPI00047DAC44|nr:pyridoxamine 5'-phosphate oxidase family protein [Actinomadura oligospora]
MPEQTEITSPDELRALLGEVMPRARDKERPLLHARDREWLAASPFCLIATSDADGNCDVSPKGDPAGQLAHVLSDRAIAIAERPGNRRADGYFNVLSNPHAGLLFFIPGRNETLRINGRARLVREAPYFDAMVVKGHRPLLALELEIETIYFHCAKSFLRSQLWKPETWDPDVLPSHARITKEVMATPESVEELEEYYGESYSKRLYKS